MEYLEKIIQKLTNNSFSIILFVLMTFMLVVDTFAQGPPPPPAPTPIGGGVLLLLAGAVGYGAKKIYSANKD